MKVSIDGTSRAVAGPKPRYVKEALTLEISGSGAGQMWTKGKDAYAYVRMFFTARGRRFSFELPPETALAFAESLTKWAHDAIEKRKQFEKRVS